MKNYRNPCGFGNCNPSGVVDRSIEAFLKFFGPERQMDAFLQVGLTGQGSAPWQRVRKLTLAKSHGMAEGHQVCYRPSLTRVCLDCAGYKVELVMPQCLSYGEVSGSSRNIRDWLLPRRLNSPHHWKKLRSPWCRPSFHLGKVMAGHGRSFREDDPLDPLLEYCQQFQQ